MPRLGTDRQDEAIENLQEGDVNDVGTPGNTGLPSDGSGIGAAGGVCNECNPRGL